MSIQSSEILSIADRRELFVDRHLIERLDGTWLKLHEPHPAETAIRLDRSWEGPFNAGLGVMAVDGGYRMYYRALKADAAVRICYAESEDGIRWTKPEAGRVEWEGSRRNNLLFDGIANFDLFYDTRPGVAADERFKMTQYFVGGQKITPYYAGKGGQEGKEIYLLVSGDGFTFREAERTPVLTCDWPNAFDSQNAFFWSEAEQKYVAYFRFMDPLRTMARITSPDFRTWSMPEAMTYGDTPREELYTNATLPYFRAPHIYVALPARFMKGRRVVSDDELARMEVASYGPYVYYNDCSDAVFMSTRAGTTVYDRTFMEAFVRPGPGQNNWVSRTNFPVHGLLQTGPEELSFYVSRDYAQPTWHIRRYTLRVDGFASVNAPYHGGEMVTRVLTFSGAALEINFATSAAGSVQVEIRDAENHPLPGYTVADCDTLVGDAIARRVSWQGKTDVARFVGTPVRLRFVLRDADLYAIKFG